MLRYFENGEDVPFAVEFLDDDPNVYSRWACEGKEDELGTKVFRVNSDHSLTRVSASRAEVWLERARAISESEAFTLASI